jgi:hypothetical protein
MTRTGGRPPIGRADIAAAARAVLVVHPRPRDAARGTARRVAESNRRTRIGGRVSHSLGQLLRRVAAVHASLCGVIRLYAGHARAGGDSLNGADYARRLADGDRSILDEFLTAAVEELTAIRAANAADMEAGKPAVDPPGTAGKVDELARRASEGRSLFRSDDTRPDLR